MWTVWWNKIDCKEIDYEPTPAELPCRVNDPATQSQVHQFNTRQLQLQPLSTRRVNDAIQNFIAHHCSTLVSIVLNTQHQQKQWNLNHGILSGSTNVCHLLEGSV